MTSTLSGPGIGCLLPAGLLPSGLFFRMSPTFFNLSHQNDGDQSPHSTKDSRMSLYRIHPLLSDG
ncbi:hypothetical protein LEMLEM_LOCUS6620, partial [Lemmus lemmus]